MDCREEFENIFEEMLEKLRYGKLWTEFTIEELAEYARFKAKRGKILVDKNIEKSTDDFLDAANIMIMCVLNLRQENRKE